MFLLIDNYDSFTYNLVQAFLQLGKNPVVVKNNDPRLLEMATSADLSMVCISPGPSNPQNAGYCLEFLEKLPKHIPVLGVCLGHQILGHFAGATVAVNNEIVHGKQSQVFHTGSGLFSGISFPMTVGRYHSLTVFAEEVPDILSVTAITEDLSIMALSYNDRPWAGVQFHPESILTPEGIKLLSNFPDALLANKEAKNGPISINICTQMVKETKPPISLILEHLAQGKNLTADEAGEAFSLLMNGDLSLEQTGALLMGLRLKGETPEELSAAVSAILAKAVHIPPIDGKSIDIVGTGGDNKGSFNCSTATSLVLAGMGYKVLKHGNRSVSSRCGSADVLEKLGVPLDVLPSAIPSILKKEGFAFLFAPHFHPAFRHVIPARKGLGIRTLFNILGPLVNPASPTHHLIGVSNPAQLSLVAKTLAKCEPKCIGAVIHGHGGYDELTTLGPAEVILIQQGSLKEIILDPLEFGFDSFDEEDLSVADVDDALDVLKKILTGKGPKPMLDMLAFNVGLALYLLSLPNTMESLDPKKGYDLLQMQKHMDKAKEAVYAGAGARFITAYGIE